MAGDLPEDDFDATRTSIGAAVLLKKDRLLAGRYRIIAPIGVGGMGLVYKAHDERLKLDVALKVLRPERAPDAAMLERFEREIVLAREVSHPNVLRIHDIGEDGELHFITMDLVEGRSLRALLEDTGTLEPAQAAALAADIAEGLHAAHEKGVVHRDLKPANILLDDKGKAYISDFGVARSLHAASLTHTGLIVGSPDYLSPEQASGGDIDGRTDIYALGLMLYEMVTGELPFRGGTLEELIAQRTIGEPRDLAQSGVKVPAWLRRIIYRCLQKEPDRRYATAGELAADLRSHSAPAFRLPRAGRGMRVAVVAMIGITAIAAIASYLMRNTESQRDATRVAVLPLVNDTGDASLDWIASGFTDVLDTYFSESPSVAVIETARVTSTLEDLRLAPASLDQRSTLQLAEMLGADRLISGAIRRSGDELVIDARLVNAAGGKPDNLRVTAPDSQPLALVDNLSIAIRRALSVREITVDTVSSSSPEALQAYTDGRNALRRGDPAAAIPLLQSAVDADPAFGIAWLHLAQSYDMTGRSDDARDATARAIELASDELSRNSLQARALEAALDGDFELSRNLLQQLIERFPSDLPTSIALAEAYGDEGRFDEASTILREVVGNDPNHPRAWFLLGKYAIQSGDSRRAIDDYLVRDLVIQNRLGNALGRANVLNALGIAYGRLGQFEQARENYEQAAELRREIGDQRGLATSLNNIARLEMMAGNFDAARSSLERAQEVSRELGDQAGLAAFTNTIGTLEEEAGNHADALKHYRDALKIREALGDRRALTESYNNVGFAYYMLGELDNARIYWERALSEARELGNRDGEMQGLQSLGLLHAARGEWDEGSKVFLQALEISRSVNYPEAEAVSLGYLGQIAAMEGRYSAALSLLDEASQILEPIGDTRGLAEFGLQRARIYRELQLDDALSEQLARVEQWLAETPNLEQQAEVLRLKASLPKYRSEAGAMLEQATTTALRSGSVQALMRTEISTAQIALQEQRLDEALRIARALAENARRDGFAPMSLAAQEIVVRARAALEGQASARRDTTRLLDLLDNHLPYADAYRIRALAAEILAAAGDGQQALRQQRLAEEEVARLRANLPPTALDVFNAQSIVNEIEQEALVDGD